jgi:hypothetical protein
MAFPERIPHDANALSEVTLEGSFNANREAPYRGQLTVEALRVLRPGGDIHLHGLTGDRPGNGERPVLPGPAAQVQYVPTPDEIVTELTRAGFVHVRIVLLSQTAYFVVNGVAMRECRIQAKKPGHRPKQKTHYAVYRGPLAEVTDDFGNVFHRGELTPLNVHDWQMLSGSDAGPSFVFLSPGQEHEKGAK